MLTVNSPYRNSRKLSWTGFGLTDIYQAIMAHWYRIAIGAALALAIAAVLIAMTPRTYTAYSSVIYDPTRSINLGSETAWLQPSVETSMRIESQVEVIRSITVAKHVIEKLDLTKDAEFNRPPSAISQLVRWPSAMLSQVMNGPAPKVSKSAKTADQKVEKILPNILERLGARRVGRSAVITIQFWSTDPEKAVKIANAFADAYLEVDLAQKAKVLQSGSDWLQSKVDDLREKALQAQLEVERFKRQGRGSISGSIVTLTGLESEANTLRSLYETVRLQLIDTTQKVSYPISDARKLSQASISTVSSSPKTKLILAFAFLLGSAIAVLFTLIKLSQDGIIRTAEDLSLLGLPLQGRMIASQSRSRLAHRLDRLRSSAFSSDQKSARPSQTHRYIPNLVATMMPPLEDGIIGVSSVREGVLSDIVCTELALHFAKRDKNVLVISVKPDAPFQISPETGTRQQFRITEIGEGTNNERPSPTTDDDGIDRMTIDGLKKSFGNEQNATEFMTDLAEQYDHCLVDMGSVLISENVDLISPCLDQLILAVRAKSVSQGEVMETINYLREDQGILNVTLLLQEGALARGPKTMPTSSSINGITARRSTDSTVTGVGESDVSSNRKTYRETADGW